MSEKKRVQTCDLCGKDLSSQRHNHLLKSIPHEDAVYLLNIFGKTEAKRICCVHFNDHDLVFKFSSKTYPGVKKIEV